MSATLTVRDETTFAFGGEEREFTLDFLAEKVTVRDLLRARVYGEVEEFNARRSGLFRGLVQPTDTERVLDGFRVREGRRIDAEGQFDRALEAFGRNGFLLLVDDLQVDDLEETIEVGPGTTVTFLKLAPLVGG